MARLSIPNIKTIVKPTSATSSLLSSSLTGNMNLIQSQINQKSNDYINIKNAVKILDVYDNWNGYIKLYTEFENNFNVNDTVYITYTEPDAPDSETFNIQNPSDFNIPFEPFIDYYLGYKVLYVNKFKNEIVINRYYNDIPTGSLLKNQSISKVSCRGGYFYGGISDGVVFYNSNILNGNFGTMLGTVSGITNTGLTVIEGATILCVGLITISDINGKYLLNVPSGLNIVKCAAPGYITNTFYAEISSTSTNIVNIMLTGGTNSITITNTSTGINPIQICNNDIVYFTSSTIGFDAPVKYQWKINNMNVGTNNSVFSYGSFNNGDVVTCQITDTINSTTSNSIAVYIVPKSINISVYPSNTINQGDTVILSALTSCYVNPAYQWRAYNTDYNFIIGSGQSFSTNILNNNDTVVCKIGTDSSNLIVMTVLPTTTTTTTLPITSTTTTTDVITTTTTTDVITTTTTTDVITTTTTTDVITTTTTTDVITTTTTTEAPVETTTTTTL